MEMFCDAVSIATGLRCWVGCERKSGLEMKCEEDEPVDEHLVCACSHDGVLPYRCRLNMNHEAGVKASLPFEDR